MLNRRQTMLAIKSGLVRTMDGRGDLEGATVLVEDGKIAAVGRGLEIPPDAQVIDAAGLIVAPGLVEGHCHVGMWEEGMGFEGSDGNESVDPITPQLRAIDSLNPMDEGFSKALKAGVTTIITGPGSANVVGGTFAAVKTAGHRIDSMVLRSPVAMKVAFGENPKRTYSSKGKSPSTRMATAALLRELLFKAREYMEKKEKAAQKEDGKAPDFNMKLEAMIPVLKKEIPLKAHAHRADDIFTAIRIAREFDVRLTLDHCTDGSLIASDLAREQIGCLVGPTLGHKSKIELQHRDFETAKDLARSGVKIAIITDSPVIPTEYLSLCAALSHKAGLPLEEAWKAVTINPAEITGVADRVGSLTEGKDADIAIFDGDPIQDIQARVRCVIVDGVVAYKAP